MKIFESSINKGFGGVEETGLLINISDIYPEKKDRHIKPLEMWADRFKMKWWKRGARRRKKGGEDSTGSRYGIRIN